MKDCTAVSNQPLISIIVPARNEAKSLSALLASLVAQDLPPSDFEIIVADGASTDSTREIVRRAASESLVPVRLIDNPGIHSGPGRNAGLRVARGEFILFIDGHCLIPSVSLLRDTLLLFRQTNAACLCRPQPLLARTCSSFGKAIAAVRASALGHGRDSLIYDLTVSGFVDPASSGAAYRREVFAKIGNYDESFDACEDVELNTRVRKNGMSAYTDPRLAVFYEPRSNLSSLIKQMIRYGTGRARLFKKHPDSASVGQLAPSILVAYILAFLSCAIARFPQLVWLRATICAPVLVYLAVVILSSAALVRRSGFKILYRAPLIYFAIHIGLGLGILAETIRIVLYLPARQFQSKAASIP